MAVDETDVRHVADLARLGLDPDRIGALVRELNAILGHMQVLEAVPTRGEAASGADRSAQLPLREDAGTPIPLLRPLEAFAPEMRDGFFLVPRLATHEDVVDDAP